jgi:hypothetical protein
MHTQNLVHGDIRGFNMLHPFPPGDDPQGQETAGIKESLLIDFDLSGKADQDRYPPGYSRSVSDNVFDRSGVAGKLLRKVDDWKDLGSVMANYSISLPPTSSNAFKTLDEALKTLNEAQAAQDAWITLCNSLRKEGQGADSLIHKFIQDRGDFELQMNPLQRQNLEEIVIKGTGSPNKLQQGPRGSLTVDHSGSKKGVVTQAGFPAEVKGGGDSGCT